MSDDRWPDGEGRVTAGPDAGRLPDNFRVTVCDACLMACCWQGEFMCDKARTAGTKTLPVSELRRLHRESEDYWSR